MFTAVAAAHVKMLDIKPHERGPKQWSIRLNTPSENPLLFFHSKTKNNLAPGFGVHVCLPLTHRYFIPPPFFLHLLTPVHPIFRFCVSFCIFLPLSLTHFSYCFIFPKTSNAYPSEPWARELYTDLTLHSSQWCRDSRQHTWGEPGPGPPAASWSSPP